MVRLLNRCFAIVGLCVVLSAVGCNLKPTEPFDPRAIQQNERAGATVSVQELEPHRKRALPTTLESPFLKGQPGTRFGAPDTTRPAEERADVPPPTTGPALETDPIVRMPLQEIMQRAVANNLEVKVAGFGPAIESTRVVEAEARYDPTVFVNSQFERRDNKQAAQFTSDANADIFTVQSGVRRTCTVAGRPNCAIRQSGRKTAAAYRFSIPIRSTKTSWCSRSRSRSCAISGTP